ncbi:Smr/MutS family protein [Jiulongibacter sp. NS-SX5]|uniref:Smr/MutS family protein n=1 Tax=Jiulongibacter sp. NS-SX5 TaxID=3463854 RepID=UPI0040581823
MGVLEVGDKVRMLRSSEEGVVLKVSGNIVDIETTDGFVIPVTVADLAKVSNDEQKFFRQTPSTSLSTESSSPDSLFAHRYEEAITLAFEEVSEMKLRVWLINHFDADVHFVLSQKKKNAFVNFSSGNCKKGEEVKLDLELPKSDFDKWSKLLIQLLSFKKGEQSKPLLTKDIHLKASSVFKNVGLIGNTNKKGYSSKVSLKTEETIKQEENEYFQPSLLVKNKTIDLHAEALGLNPNNLELLKEQLGFFNKEFDYAIANDLSELTVIHGVGNGVLRSSIHKIIAKSEYVEWFKDAQKEKFGYGATIIHFKA